MFAPPRMGNALRDAVVRLRRQEVFMVKTELSLPELAMVVGTRGMLGMGLGLLLSSRLGDERRRGAGWTLAAIGVLSTIPLAWMVLHRRHEVPNDAGGLP